MLKAWKALTQVVGTMTIIGILAVIIAIIYDSVTKKTIKYNNVEDDYFDDEDDFLDDLDL